MQEQVGPSSSEHGMFKFSFTYIFVSLKITYFNSMLTIRNLHLHIYSRFYLYVIKIY